MKTCSKSLVIFLKLIYITLLPVLEGQKIKALPEVTGYIGHDVTLPCKVIPGSGSESPAVSQVQWNLEPPGEEERVILVSNPDFGVSVNESFQDRLKISEQDLIIRDVNLRDAGLYTCSITTYPSGALKGSTTLVVREKMRLSPVQVSAIVIAVLLLVVAAATVYLVFIRKRRSTVRHQVYIGTGGPSIIRDEDVVYSDIKLKPSRDAKLSSLEKHTADDITYSEVVVFRQEPKSEDMYARVIKV